MYKKYLFIVNPTSGKQNSDVFLVPNLHIFISQNNLDATVILTEYPGHATEIVREFYSLHGAFRAVSCGGDGTLNEVMQAAKNNREIEVACVPCGTGNDFLSNFGTKEDFLSLKRNVVNGVARPVDVIDIGEKISVAICSVGIDADIANLLPKYRRAKLLGGSLAYNAAIAERLLRPIPINLKISADGEDFSGDYTLVSIANGKFYGGGFCAAPSAVVDDGVLELCLVKKVNLLRFAKVVGRYKAGKHIENGDIIPELRDVMELRHVKRVTVKRDKPFVLNADGECSSVTEFIAEVSPKSVMFVTPKGL